MRRLGDMSCGVSSRITLLTTQCRVNFVVVHPLVIFLIIMQTSYAHDFRAALHVVSSALPIKYVDTIPCVLKFAADCTPEILQSGQRNPEPVQRVEELTVVKSEIRRVVLSTESGVEIRQKSIIKGLPLQSGIGYLRRDLHDGSTVKITRSPRRLLTPRTPNETFTALVETGPNTEDDVLGVFITPLRNLSIHSDSSSDDDDDDETSFELYHALILVVGILIIFIMLSSWWFHQRFKKRRQKSNAPSEEMKAASVPEEAPAAAQPESSVRHLGQRVIEEMMDVYCHVPLEETQEKRRKQDTPVPPLNLRSASYNIRRTRSLELNVLSSMPNFKMDASFSTSAES